MKKIMVALLACLTLLTAACGKKYDTGNEELDKALKAAKPYEALDYVTLGEYKGVKVDVGATDEEVSDRVSQVLEENKNERIKEGTVKDGDTVNIDYTGYMNGEAFDGGSDKGYDLVIGSNTFIPGFEEGLIGVDVGDTFDLDVVFPEDYQNNPDFSGKPATFIVTVNYIKGEEKERVFDDAFVQEITDNEYSTADSYKEKLREDIINEKKEKKEETAYGEAIGSSTVSEVPQFIIDLMRVRLDANYRAMAESYGYTDFDKFVTETFGTSTEEFDSQIKEAAKQHAEEMLITKAIAEKEGIEVSEEEYNDAVSEYARQNGVSGEEELTKLAATEYGTYLPDLINESIIARKVTALIAENAVEEGGNQ